MSDMFAMALALWTKNQVQRGDRDGDRLNAIAALVNGTLLLAISIWLRWKGWGCGDRAADCFERRAPDSVELDRTQFSDCRLRPVKYGAEPASYALSDQLI